ncbi:hypothetical protein DM860_000941 [Cuscuta australis]|uniref:BZIP domain-containing protein n=1 Tax=Cuscuta australis TaxID=267555 RepID=A0A328DWQ7_9ASTE|nr:hypothetical protein DM860_000941 [Cuscuta australis]
MAKTEVADPPPPPPSNLNLTASTFDSGDLDDALPIPEATHFFPKEEKIMDDFDFDFSFDDFYLPSGDFDSLNHDFDFDPVVCDPVREQHIGLNSYGQPGAGCDPIGAFKSSACIFKSSSSELCHFSTGQIAGDAVPLNPFSPELGSNVSEILFLNSPEPDQNCGDVSGYLNVTSPESNGSNPDASQPSWNENQCSSGDVVLDCLSPESQGSGNSRLNASPTLDVLSTDSEDKSVNSSTDFGNANSIKTGVVDQKFKLGDANANSTNINNCSSSMLKRKKQSEETNNVECRSSKYRKPADYNNNENYSESNRANITSEEEDRRKTRLMRNRESAQLSRQRKKHYVEELEDKVRKMHSTIQDLNAKISYMMAENASLRQQVGGKGVAITPQMPPPPPGMYPPVIYPWMPCAPPYMVKPQGSQVPLVPIPRLKPHKTASAPKNSKKSENKKKEAKTKSVASISFIGLLFFIFIFGGLVPSLNVRYGGMREAFTRRSNDYTVYTYEKHPRRVLATNNGSGRGESYGGKYFSNITHSSGGQDHGGGGKRHSEKGKDEFVQSGNGSSPLAASLYVPRNDKLVKIDGNLIIHSVLASEKAMASHGSDEEKRRRQETGLAVPENMASAITGGRHPQLYQGAAERHFGSDSIRKDNMRSTGAADGMLQQWFKEGLSGPMLSSGMCTEVFQFDVSSAIVPASSMRNVSQNAKKGRNRRILSVPLSPSSHNISGERKGEGDELKGNNSLASSMVVSVLVDPREGGDGDGDGVMGKKSLSRIFVVVLVDSVKYVTYSCILPLKGSVPHLVTT